MFISQRLRVRCVILIMFISQRLRVRCVIFSLCSVHITVSRVRHLLHKVTNSGVVSETQTHRKMLDF
jgi:hypothetical protein